MEIKIWLPVHQATMGDRHDCALIANRPHFPSNRTNLGGLNRFNFAVGPLPTFHCTFRKWLVLTLPTALSSNPKCTVALAICSSHLSPYHGLFSASRGHYLLVEKVQLFVGNGELVDSQAELLESQGRHTMGQSRPASPGKMIPISPLKALGLLDGHR